MRRGVGVVLVAMGAFLVAFAPLLRFQVADKLVQAPANQYSVLKFTAPGARYFSMRDLKVLTGDLNITVTVRGDVKESKDDHVVWDQFTAASDVTNANPRISMTQFRSAFNKYNGQGVTCCGASVDSGDGAQPVRLRGQIFLFPFGVEKKTYPVFNADVREAHDAVFAGEDTVNGLPVYKFTQKIPPTVTDTLSAPASVLGMKGTGDVEVERVYDGTITFWVEPNTGVAVKQEQRRNEMLRTSDGVERLPALVATATFTPETVSDMVRTARDNMAQITLIKTTLPLVALILGLALTVVGAWLLLSRPRRVD